MVSFFYGFFPLSSILGREPPTKLPTLDVSLYICMRDVASSALVWRTDELKTLFDSFCGPSFGPMFFGMNADLVFVICLECRFRSGLW